MSHNPCESRQEEIVALAIGELDPDRAGELLRHLETCPECRSLYEEVVEREAFVQATFAKISKAIQPAPADSQPIEQVVPPAEPVAGTVRRSRVQRWKWTPMKVLALAAVFVLAATGLFSRLHLTSPSFGATFASVLQRIQKAVSVKYTRTVEAAGEKPIVFHDMATDGGRMRTIRPGGQYYVCDFVNGKRLSLDPVRKVGRYTHMAHHNKDRLSSYLEWISTLHNTSGRLIGQEDRDGHLTNVFHLEQPFEQFTIWADVHTNLPVRVERVLSPCKGMAVPEVTLSLDDFLGVGDAAESSATRPEGSREYTIRPTGPGVRQERVVITMTDFVWDVALDESLFWMSPPEGYAVDEESSVDLGNPPVDQEALIATLRFWAEVSNGQFPADIDALPDVRSQLIRRFDKDGPAEQEFAEALKMAHVVLNGIVYVKTLAAANNWSYAGRDIRLGDAGKPLCWWRSAGASTYRVVYGDLTLRDVPPGEVPQMEKP